MSAVFVHVSDIHFGQEKDQRLHIHNDVKDQLIADAREVIARVAGGTAHGILVTGDIAHSGQWSEFEEAGKWLDRLAASVGVQNHQVQMVPGNHDLDRNKQSLAGTSILDHIRAGGSAEYEAILKNPIDKAALLARFEDYNRFSYGYDCPLNDDLAFESGLEVTLAPDRSVRFIRFNSALLCHGGERDENPELIIGSRQFTIPRDAGVENVVLVHHPLNWYKDQSEALDYIRSRARILISGHEHNPKVDIESVEDGCDLMLLAAGATVPFKSNDEYTFTYNVIELDWDKDSDGLSVTIHPRAWNRKKTRFEGDDRRLGGREPKFLLGCPHFREMQSASIASKTTTGSEGLASIVPFAEPILEKVALEAEVGVVVTRATSIEGYDAAKLKFFRDLTESQRLRILVGLGALTDSGDERITQGVERRLLDMLVMDGKIGEIVSLTSTLIAERDKERK